MSSKVKYIIVADSVRENSTLREVYRIIKYLRRYNANVKILIVTDLDGKIIRAIIKDKNVRVEKISSTLL